MDYEAIFIIQARATIPEEKAQACPARAGPASAAGKSNGHRVPRPCSSAPAAQAGAS